MNVSADQIYEELLVLRAQSGDTEAASLLVARWQPRLLKDARLHLGDPDAAADAAQETWLRAFRRFDQLREPAAFGAWLRRIARNTCNDELRRRARQPQQSDEDPVATDNYVEPVDRYLAALPAAQREVMFAFYVECVPIADIAKRLQRPVGTIKSRLHHARLALRALLEPQQ